MADLVRVGFDQLIADQQAARAGAESALSAFDSTYFQAYKHLISLNAWRQYLLQAVMPPGALGFFVEAHNDALVSLLLARSGMWRPSLQSLRSVVENILAALYYQDHRIECELWDKGRFRIGAADLFDYFESHPLIHKVSKDVSGLSVLESEYATLSRAVHGSSTSFRMTKAGDVPVVFASDKSLPGKWAANQRHVMLGVNLLLVALYSDRIAGAGHASIRTALSFVLTGKQQRSKIKKTWNVVLAG